MIGRTSPLKRLERLEARARMLDPSSGLQAAEHRVQAGTATLEDFMATRSDDIGELRDFYVALAPLALAGLEAGYQVRPLGRIMALVPSEDLPVECAEWLEFRHALATRKPTDKRFPLTEHLHPGIYEPEGVAASAMTTLALGDAGLAARSRAWVFDQHRWQISGLARSRAAEVGPPVDEVSNFLCGVVGVDPLIASPPVEVDPLGNTSLNADDSPWVSLEALAALIRSSGSSVGNESSSSSKRPK